MTWEEIKRLLCHGHALFHHKGIDHRRERDVMCFVSRTYGRLVVLPSSTGAVELTQLPFQISTALHFSLATIPTFSLYHNDHNNIIDNRNNHGTDRQSEGWQSIYLSSLRFLRLSSSFEAKPTRF